MIYTEDGCSIFLRNVGTVPPDCCTLHNSDDFSMKGHTSPSVCGSDCVQLVLQNPPQPSSPTSCPLPCVLAGQPCNRWLGANVELWNCVEDYSLEGNT